MAILVARAVSIGNEAVAELDQRQGEEEMEPTTEVSPGEPPRADHIDGVVGGEVGEKGVVEDVGADEPEVSEEEDTECEQHVAGGGEEEK